jgi:hypothetical protein
LVAAGFAAIYPNLWQIDSLLYPEGLMALLVTITIILAYRWRDRPRLSTAAWLGAVIALAALARGEAVLLVPLLAVPWILLTRTLSRRARLRHLVVTIVACAAVLAPWMIRNATTFEKFVPLSTNGNEVMVYANCPTAYNGANVGYWDFQCQERVRQAGDPPGDESQTALYWRSLGINYARDHAGELPRVVTLRVLRQWELFRPLQNVRLAGIEGRNHDASTMGLLMFYGLAGLSIVGAVSMRRRRIPLLPLGVRFLGVTITAAYTYGSVRFRAPAEPALCVLGAIGLVPVVALARRWLERGPGLSVEPDGAPFVAGGRGGLRPRLGGAWQRGAIATWAAVGSVLALIALPLRGLYHTTGGTMEEAFMMVFPERMLKGDLPNRDFLHLYGPGALQVLMGWYKLVGISLESERTFGLIQHLAIAALFTLKRPWGRYAASAVAGSRVLRADADRAHGHGMERRPGIAPLEHRVRPTSPHARQAAVVTDRGRGAGGSFTDVPTRPGVRPRRRLRVVLVAKSAVAHGGARRSGRCCRSVASPWSGRARRSRMLIDPVFKLRARRAATAWSHWTARCGRRRNSCAVVECRTRGRQGDLLLVLRDVDRAGRRHVDRDSFVAAIADAACGDAAGRWAAERGAGPTGPAATRFDAPVMGYLRLVPVPDPGRHRVRQGSQTAIHPATARLGRTRRHARADTVRRTVVHVPVLPAAHTGQPRQRADTVPGFS